MVSHYVLVFHIVYWYFTLCILLLKFNNELRTPSQNYVSYTPEWRDYIFIMGTTHESSSIFNKLMLYWNY
jgi:hypothetical protein